MTTKPNKVCYVQFQFSQKTSPGEEIHITGDIPSLGKWNVDKSEKMVTNDKEYPVWKSRENIIVEQDTDIQYKYLIFYNKKFKCWENSANRHVKIGKYYKVVISDPGSKIINSVSDQNLSNISNSEISKTDNPFNEEYSKLIGGDDMDFTNINNEIFLSELNNNTLNNEEQFIFSNKKNDLILVNEEKNGDKFSKEFSEDNAISIFNNSFKINIEYNDIYFNIPPQIKTDLIDLNIKNIINEIALINSQIFNNILKEDLYENNIKNDIKRINMEKNENEKNTEEILTIENKNQNEINIINPENAIYNKIIICCIYLPIEIKGDSIYPSSDYIYPNLYQLQKTNSNIYYIGLIKNSKNIKEKNRESLYQRLKKEYRMHPIDISTEFEKDLFKYFNQFMNPLLNNLPINITNIKNNNISEFIQQIHYKFNEIVYQNIINIMNNDKIIIYLFDYYFAYLPQILYQNLGEKIDNEIGIQYIFLNKIFDKERFIMLPCYKDIIKSLLFSNIIVFNSFYNCYKFLNLTKLLKEYNYKINIEGDIILDINLNDNNEIKNSHNLILKVENIFPDYQLFKSIINDNLFNIENSEVFKIISNVKKNENHFIFLSIDDIKYCPFIKIKLLGLKSFLENNIYEEKNKITFIQVIEGECINKNETNNINNNININEEKEKGKDKICENSLEEISSIINEINSNSDNKIIELYQRSLTLNEKIFLLKNADCFINTINDINSPFILYEFLMAKLINNTKKLSELSSEENNKLIEKSKLPIIEYIISNQIKEIPGLNEYIYANPYEIKDISNAFYQAFRNLINCHKNIAKRDEYSKEKDFNFVKKYFNIEKKHFNRINNAQEEQLILNCQDNNINKVELLNNIDINEIIGHYNEIIKISKKDPTINKLYKIISINIDYFFEDKSIKKTTNTEQNNLQKFYQLLSNLISISLNHKENKIVLFSNKEESELDFIMEKYIKENEQKYQNSFLLLTNIIITSEGGYSFKKLSNYKKEEDYQWIKLNLLQDEIPYSEKEILNILLSYKKNYNNMKIEQRANKFYIYDDDCNKDQVSLYIDDFKNKINKDENLKNILYITKIKNGFCIKNILNYKAIFFLKIIKEMINLGKMPKFILFFGFNKTDEILYKYLNEKKKIIERYINEETYIFCIKLINSDIKDDDKNEKIKVEKKYDNLYYNDNFEEIFSFFNNLVNLENQDSKN